MMRKLWKIRNPVTRLLSLLQSGLRSLAPSSWGYRTASSKETKISPSQLPSLPLSCEDSKNRSPSLPMNPTSPEKSCEKCGQNLQDSTSVSTGSSGNNSPAQSVIIKDDPKSVISLILVSACIVAVFGLFYRFGETNERVDLKVAAGIAEAEAVANNARREAALAREDTIEIREKIFSLNNCTKGP